MYWYQVTWSGNLTCRIWITFPMSDICTSLIIKIIIIDLLKLLLSWINTVYVLNHCSSSPPWVSRSSYTIATKKTRSCQSMLYITTYAALWQNDSIRWVSYEQVLNIFVNIVIQFNILTGLKVCIYTKRFWRKLNVPCWLRSILIRNAQIGTLLAVVISNSQQ